MFRLVFKKQQFVKWTSHQHIQFFDSSQCSSNFARRQTQGNEDACMSSPLLHSSASRNFKFKLERTQTMSKLDANESTTKQIEFKMNHKTKRKLMRESIFLFWGRRLTCILIDFSVLQPKSKYVATSATENKNETNIGRWPNDVFDDIFVLPQFYTRCDNGKRWIENEHECKSTSERSRNLLNERIRRYRIIIH